MRSCDGHKQGHEHSQALHELHLAGTSLRDIARSRLVLVSLGSTAAVAPLSSSYIEAALPISQTEVWIKLASSFCNHVCLELALPTDQEDRLCNTVCSLLLFARSGGAAGAGALAGDLGDCCGDVCCCEGCLPVSLANSALYSALQPSLRSGRLVFDAGLHSCHMQH